MASVVSELLSLAAEEVERAHLPAEFRTAAFEKAVDLLSAEQKSSGSGRERLRGVDHPGSEDEFRLASLSRRLDVAPEALQEVFDAKPDILDVVVSSGKLDPTQAGGAKQVALLVAAGRQAAGYDEDWTTVGVIRERCRDYGKFDPGNFAKTILDMRDVFSVRGRGQQREVRVTKLGWERAQELIANLI